MPEETIEEKTTADASSLEEFKDIRHGKAPASAEPAEEKTPQPEEGKPAESAAPAGSVETKVQESEALPPVDKSIDDQIRELRKAGKHAKANELERKAGAETARAEARAERERVEAKNRELEQEVIRLRAGSPAQNPPANQPVPQISGDPEPKVTDAKYQTSDGYQQWIIDKAKWEFRADARKAEETQKAQAHQQKGKAILEAGKAKTPDFDTVVSKVRVNTGVLAAGVEQIANIGDVLYEIGKNPAEITRIASLSPNDQWYELRSLSAKLASPAVQPAPPVVLKPAVSRVTPPPRVLTGISEPPPAPLSEAKDYEDFKRRRKAS